ncbi:hypothetical protein [Burkholderia alba]|uniref:hypothetical protein n=1 Tax=Burkholderia alba TaxID=2683677 RepID=UPI002B05F2E1|nr:hypothetical protein [Burkholderia alba]
MKRAAVIAALAGLVSLNAFAQTPAAPMVPEQHAGPAMSAPHHAAPKHKHHRHHHKAKAHKSMADKH